MSHMPADPPSVPASNQPTPWWVIAGWTVVVLIVPIMLALVNVFPDLDRRVVMSPVLYFSLVAAVAVSGIAVALAVIIAALQALDGRALATGLGLLCGAAIFLIHALVDAALPNARPDLPIIGQVIVSTFLVLGAFDPLSRSRDPLRRQWPRLLALSALVLIAGAFWSIVLETSEHAAAWLIGASVTIVACGIALWRYIQLYRQSSLHRSFALLAGIVLLGEAALARLFTASAFNVPFWLCHFAIATGMAFIAYAFLYEVRSQRQRNLMQRAAYEQARPVLVAAMDVVIETLERGDPFPPDTRIRFQREAGLSDAQIDALERLALAIARERRQREALAQLDELLRRSERNTALLAQMVIHDLKNPLTALIGFLELLSAADLSESQRSLIDSALRNGRDLAGLVDDLLDLIRYNEGRLRLRLGDVSLPVLCAECADELAGWLLYESKTLILDVSPTLPLIRADARILKRILLNLLSNAIKHTPRGTLITLRVWREPHPDRGEQTVIEVADTGPGIPPERIERLFEPFGAAGESRSLRQSSTGLGLAFCKMAVTAHGGTIEVSSFPGDGATFRIRLPDL
ncbi:sensor histidine kinase [Roseiflexus castenholzii]|uniref:histidine kinase n=1 Tax=Roseiflexus castenholzii (strain DSM 13941 / HLO8) TaxID=383372 RepID=A7NN46_ROSCS|nr:HAMP domain-containing sensor histidine kinase [Roseiflexus castenholzii]ABU58978.1 integral membrane sensor signal transduction histidine kinase [Roseiflexus castenholzii DSM 13941]